MKNKNKILSIQVCLSLSGPSEKDNCLSQLKLQQPSYPFVIRRRGIATSQKIYI